MLIKMGLIGGKKLCKSYNPTSYNHLYYKILYLKIGIKLVSVTNYTRYNSFHSLTVSST